MGGLLVIGAGGHGRVVADAAEASGEWSKIAFLDDRYPDINYVHGWQVLGNLEVAQDYLTEYSHIALGIGNNHFRLALLNKFCEYGYIAATIIHPTASVSKYASIYSGTVVFASSVINIGAVVESGCIVNTGATVDHDCSLAPGVHISPGAHLAGEVSVGSCSWIGTGASIIQQVSIGSNVVVGAGAAITRNIPDNVTVVGVPGKIISVRR